MGINTIAIAGNLGRDAETRTAASGSKFTRFSMGFNERRRMADGTWENETGWIGCVIFGERGEKLAPFLKKGVSVTVQGKLSYSEYTGKDGNKRSAYEVVVEELSFTAPAAPKETVQAEAELASADIPF